MMDTRGAETPMADHIARFWQHLETEHVRICVDLRREASGGIYWDGATFSDAVAKALVAERNAMLALASGRSEKTLNEEAAEAAKYPYDNPRDPYASPGRLPPSPPDRQQDQAETSVLPRGASAEPVAILPKRPFAFAVRRAPENGVDQWRLFMDEGEAREAAEQLGGEYEGLYRVGDRRSLIDAVRQSEPQRAFTQCEKCWQPAGKTGGELCAECGCELNGEAAYVINKQWCHSCADAADINQQPGNELGPKFSQEISAILTPSPPDRQQDQDETSVVARGADAEPVAWTNEAQLGFLKIYPTQTDAIAAVDAALTNSFDINDESTK